MLPGGGCVKNAGRPFAPSPHPARDDGEPAWALPLSPTPSSLPLDSDSHLSVTPGCRFSNVHALRHSEQGHEGCDVALEDHVAGEPAHFVGKVGLGGSSHAAFPCRFAGDNAHFFASSSRLEKSTSRGPSPKEEASADRRSRARRIGRVRRAVAPWTSHVVPGFVSRAGPR